MGPLQDATPFASQRTAVTSTEYVPAPNPVVPVGVTVNVLLHVPLRSQNCFRARTVSTDPLGIVPTTSCLLMLMVVAPDAALLEVVKVWPPTVMLEPVGIAPGIGFTAIDVCLVPVRSARSVVMFGCPTAAMLGSSGGLSSLLMKPPFWVKPALKS